VSAGYAHSLFLSRSGAVFACGFNNFGQLGMG
jgi:alpha-tubulin suppressor-like RCC1 family protein